MNVLRGLTPRDFWLKDRIVEGINDLERLIKEDGWDNDYKEFRRHAKTFAEELLYCVTEWDKYYTREKDE